MMRFSRKYADRAITVQIILLVICALFVLLRESGGWKVSLFLLSVAAASSYIILSNRP